MPPGLDGVRPRRAGDDLRQPKQPGEEAAVGRDPQHPRLVQGLGQARKRCFAVRPDDDELRQEGVVAHADLVARADASVDAQPAASGQRASSTRPVAGRKPFQASSAYSLASMAWPASDDLLLFQPERFSGRDAQLLGDQIDAGHGLGHRVLDLQPGVHLQEHEGAVVSEQELGRAGADVARRPGQTKRGLAERRSKARRDAWCRRLLDDLLMPTLE